MDRNRSHRLWVTSARDTSSYNVKKSIASLPHECHGAEWLHNCLDSLPSPFEIAWRKKGRVPGSAALTHVWMASLGFGCVVMFYVKKCIFYIFCTSTKSSTHEELFLTATAASVCFCLAHVSRRLSLTRWRRMVLSLMVFLRGLTLLWLKIITSDETCRQAVDSHLPRFCYRIFRDKIIPTDFFHTALIGTILMPTVFNLGFKHALMYALFECVSIIFVIGILWEAPVSFDSAMDMAQKTITFFTVATLCLSYAFWMEASSLVMRALRSREMRRKYWLAPSRPHGGPSTMSIMDLQSRGHGIIERANTSALGFVVVVAAAAIWHMCQEWLQDNETIQETLVSFLVCVLVVLSLAFGATKLPLSHWRRVLLGAILLANFTAACYFIVLFYDDECVSGDVPGICFVMFQQKRVPPEFATCITISLVSMPTTFSLGFRYSLVASMCQLLLLALVTSLVLMCSTGLHLFTFAAEDAVMLFFVNVIVALSSLWYSYRKEYQLQQVVLSIQVLAPRRRKDQIRTLLMCSLRCGTMDDCSRPSFIAVSDNVDLMSLMGRFLPLNSQAAMHGPSQLKRPIQSG